MQKFLKEWLVNKPARLYTKFLQLWQENKQAHLFAQGALVLTAFFLVAKFFPTGGPLVKGGRLTNFWAIPVAFYGVAVLFTKFIEDGMKMPDFLISIYEGIAGGTWLGFSYGAILILNEWYADPDNGKNEPLFTATGLASAGILAAQRLVIRAHKKAIAQRAS